MADDERSGGDEIQRLVDSDAIARLKAACCRCVDTKDWAGYGDCLTDDFHLDTEGGVRDGRDDVVAFVSRALEHATTVHHVHAPEITITGADTASAIWPMNDYVSWPTEGSPFVLRGYGHYHEEYVRTADGWRVRSSVLQRLRVDVEGEVPAGVADLATDAEGA